MIGRDTTPRTALSGRRCAAVAAGLVAIAGSVLTGAPAHADSIRAASWQLDALRVTDAHQLTQGEGITVAVIDTGVDADHPDLRGNVLPGIDAYDTDKPGTTPRTSHGTGVASLIAGHGHGQGNRDGVLGIAPKAKILPINVIDPSGRIIKPDIIGLAMQHAIARGADVICVALDSAFDERQIAAIKQGGTRGVVVVAAAGNTADGLSVAGNPARLKGALGVSSVDRKGAFSTTSVEDPELDLAAPGVDIPVAEPGGRYRTATGTSIAAALVAGTAALVRAKHPKDDWDTRLQRLAWTSDDRGPKGRDPQYGWGAVNLMAALTKTPQDANGSTVDEPSDAASASAAPVTDADPPVKIDWMAGLYSLIAVAVPIAAITWLVVVLRRRRRPANPPPAAPDPVDEGQWTRPTSTDPADQTEAPPAEGAHTPK